MKISWIPLHKVGDGVARLGLAHIPGGDVGSAQEDLDSLVDVGVRHVFALVEAEEFQWLSPPEDVASRREALASRGSAFVHDPIEDYEAPSLEQAERLVQQIWTALSANEGDVLVHCWAGLGRAGTIAACVLVALGMAAGEAITMMRFYRPGAIQSLAQETLIEAYAAQRRSVLSAPS